MLCGRISVLGSNRCFASTNSSSRQVLPFTLLFCGGVSKIMLSNLRGPSTEVFSNDDGKDTANISLYLMRAS